VKHGDLVMTPDGPGTVVSFWQVFEKWHRRTDVVVELDAGRKEGGVWRRIYRQYEVDVIGGRRGAA
jgi:hypothetical protein